MIIPQAKMQFDQRTAKLDSSIADLVSMLRPDYTVAKKVPPVLKEAKQSGQEVETSIATVHAFHDDK